MPDKNITTQALRLSMPRKPGPGDNVRRLDRQFRVTIPEAAREHLGIGEGDYVKFVVEHGEVRLRRVKLVDA